MTAKEIKKKSKAPIVLVFIILLAAAGFGYYKFIWMPEKDAQYDIPEVTTVETKELLSYNDNGNFPPLTEDVCDIMESSDATYFYIEYDGEAPNCTVYQMSKEDFNEILSAEEIGSISRRTCKFMNNFFSAEYNGIPTDPLGNNATNIFGVNTAGIPEEVADYINNLFGSGFVAYYNEHELKLSCDNTKITKFAYVHNVNTTDHYATDEYIGITKSVVTTESAIGDMNDIGVYANVGESKELTTRMAFYPCKGMSEIELLEFEIE